MATQRVVLAGGSGFIGQSLAADFHARGWEVIVLTRSPRPNSRAGRQVFWDGKTPSPEWTTLLDGAAVVVNLAGKSVSCRYTPENRRELISSRVGSVRAIGEAISQVRTPPLVWVQTSSLAIYGDTGGASLDETAPPGEGFSPEICKQWEQALQVAETPETRTVLLRIGFVLGPDGGLLEQLAKLARCFLGGTVGSGRQYISWLHMHDLSRMVRWAIERDDLQGVFNATGPNPATNAEFMATLRRIVRRPWSPPVPEPAVRLGAWLMGTEPWLALSGRRCVPRRLLDEGFAFQHPDLQEALEDALNNCRSS
jgi:uncharacterized protein (TIGR01777 family)